MSSHFLLLCTGSPLAERVLHHTIAFARLFAARVTLFCALEYPQPGTLAEAFDWRLRKAEAETYLDSLAVRLQAAGIATATVKLAGQGASSLSNYLHTHPVDLVILSNENEGGSAGVRLLFAGDWPTILPHKRISTLLVCADLPKATNTSMPPDRRLFVPYDKLSRAADGLPFVATVACVDGMRLLLLRVLCQPQAPPLATPFPQDKASVKQQKARNYAALVEGFAQSAAQAPETVALHLLRAAEIATSLHDLAEAEEVNLLILHVQCLAANSPWPHDEAIINLIAYGTTPLLIVQARFPTWTPTLVVDAAPIAAASSR